MNITKILIIGSLVFVVVFIFLLYLGVIPGLKVGTSQPPVTLEVWGVFEDSAAINPLITTYQEKHPNVTIIYRKKNIQNYREELINAFAAGRGPDIFMVHNTWVPKFRDLGLLSVANAQVWPINDYRNRFVDVVQKDFTYGGNIYGMPLYVDTLALYYNIDLFNSAGLINPPKDWDEFAKYVKLLNKKNSKGEIIVAGAAMGAGNNVLNSSDILSLIMMQNGVQMSDEDGKVTFDANKSGFSEKSLNFYTQFATPDNEYYSWSQNFPKDSQDSQAMFASGHAAMMFGYSYTKSAILLKSPRLRFDVAEMPQVKDSILRKNYADYWGYGVYIKSGKYDASWDFLKYLAEPAQSSFYLSAINEPSSQKAIIATQQSNNDLKIFANQALTADSWFQLDGETIKDILVKMIDQHISSEQSASVSLRKAAADINAQILSK